VLVEVHMLQNHAPSNLNRDDSGSPKEAVFGGYKRARISSQCLKRSIRRSEVFQTQLEGLLGTRTRGLPGLVKARMIEAGLSPEMAEIGARKASGFGTEDGKEQTPNKTGHYRTAQTMFLSQADIETVCEVIMAAAEEAGNEKAFSKIAAKDLQKRSEDKGLRSMCVDIALFGRMVTSEAFVDVEASSQFAHALSTHKVDHEFDYYTAVDDLERAADDQAGGGADMIGDVEFNSACYYKYFNVHIDGLVDNLTGRSFKRPISSEDEMTAREIAAKAVRALIKTACRVTPSGKQNSFAAFQPPSTVWVQIRDDNLPISYANAFSIPVNPRGPKGLEAQSALMLKDECESLTEMYGLQSRRNLLLSKDKDFGILGVSPSPNLQVLLDEVEKEIVRG
jgi:CRISPR system Cascade subunit CasC